MQDYMSRRVARLALFAAMVAVDAGWQSALAQSSLAAHPPASEGLEEIVVTATKREESIQKVPISIVAYSQVEMDRQGVKRVEDIVRLTPGVDFTSTTAQSQSGSALDIAIRGISDAAGISPAGTATTGIYLEDTAIQARSNQDTIFGNASPRVFDLDHVEVLRGPQGTLFGAGAEGGAVRFVMRQPSLTNYSGYGRTELSWTKYGDPSYEAGAAFGGPIMENELGFRVSAWYRNDGGFIDRFNSLTGQTDSNANRADAKVVRGALTLAPREDLTITASVHYQDSYSNGGNLLFENLSNLGEGNYVSGRVVKDPTNDTFYLPSLNVVWSLDQAEVRSITSYFNRSVHGVNDGSNYFGYAFAGSAYPVLPGQADPFFLATKQNNIAEELRVQSTNPAAAFKWTAGVYVSRNRQTDTADFVTPNLNDLLAPLTVADYFGIPLTNGVSAYSGHTVSHDRQEAAFAQADYRIYEKWTLTAGLRVARTHFDFSDQLGGPFNYPGSGPDLHTVSGSQDGKPITPKFGVAYQVNDDNMIYTSAGKGYRVGGASAPLPSLAACQTAVAQLGFNPNEYQADSVWSYEVGSKDKLLDGKAQINSSIYYIKWSDIQQFLALPACNSFGVTANLGRAVSKGFDTQVMARLTDSVTAGLGLAYNDAKFAEQVGTGTSTIIDNGDTLGLTPWSVTASLDYRYALFGHEGYLHIDDEYHSHNSGHKASLDNPDALTYDPTLPLNPSTNILNGRVGVTLADFDVSIFANNILDSHPLLGRYHDGITSPLYYDFTIRPLTVGITATWSFKGH